MGKDDRLQLLQTSFIAVVTDSLSQYGNEGIIESVTERKKETQFKNGKKNADFYGLSCTEDIFTKFCEIFDNTTWNIEKTPNGFTAETSACKLYSMARQFDTPSPCRIYCMNALEGMAKGLEPESEFNLVETLWDGKRCRVEIIK